jgi:hypothetical protein
MSDQEIDANIRDRLDRFKQDLGILDPGLIVQKHVLYGDCFILDQDSYFNLKHEVAGKFDLHSSEVLLVGSGKLGFSIAPEKRYRPFMDESDIDLALISPSLFDRIWWEAFNYWDERNAWPNQRDFKDYLFRGWLRPDFFPPSAYFRVAQDWFEFFRVLTSSGRFGPYKIGAGLYKSWDYLEAYQQRAVRACASEI